MLSPKTPESQADQEVQAVYLHVPYCQNICHYCDFAKTANFKPDHLERYSHALAEHLQNWIEQLQTAGQWPKQLRSVFFGGGTPGLLKNELANVFAVLKPHIDSQTEITLETNPNLCDSERIERWQSYGINRLSIGVQSFTALGLKKLHRDHDAASSLNALANAVPHFAGVNLDLIYGWPGQNMVDWQHDIDQVLASKVTHLSAYALTFAAGTAMGRAYQRARLDAVPDDDLVSDFYQQLCQRMQAAGWIHYEVSNWAMSHEFCSKHNLAYWQGDYYLGVGTGAHGFLPIADNPVGFRYAYSKNDRKFLSAAAKELITIEHDRDPEAWLLEYVGNGLRQSGGINLERIKGVTGYQWIPDAFLVEAIQNRQITIEHGTILKLDESMWFLEIQWAHRILACLQAP